MGTFAQQIWAQLHFPFHVVLILLLEGSQILALTLDITLKLQYLTETILSACEEPRPEPRVAIGLLRQTIEDMEIQYSRGAIGEQRAIYDILDDLPNHPICPDNGTIGYRLISNMYNDLVGNVTSALFSSMRIVPPRTAHVSAMSSSQLLRMYVELLGFVYVYFLWRHLQCFFLRPLDSWLDVMTNRWLWESGWQFVLSPVFSWHASPSLLSISSLPIHS